MSRLSRSWPVVGRAFARASLTPRLLAVLMFSFVVAGAGVLTYAQALPGLAGASPLLRELAQEERPASGYVPWGPLGRTLNASDGEGGGDTAGGGSEPLAQTEGDLLTAATDGSAVTGAASLGAGTLPGTGTLGLSLPTGGSGGPLAFGSGGPAAGGSSSGSSSSGSAGAGAGSASSGGSTTIADTPSGGSSSAGSNGASSTPPTGGSSGATAPDPTPQPDPEPAPVLSPEQGGPVPDAMEARIHQVLVEEMAKLQTLSDKAWSRIKQYESLSTSGSREARTAAYEACLNEIQPIHDLLVEISDRMRAACASSSGMDVWSQSRWYGAYVKMTEACSALELVMTDLHTAWGKNVGYDDPASNVDAWNSCMRYSASTGNPAQWDRYRQLAGEIRL